MSKLFDRAGMTTSTTGTGTVTLGSAISNAYFTFAEAGVADGDPVTYALLLALAKVIHDGTDDDEVRALTIAGAINFFEQTPWVDHERVAFYLANFRGVRRLDDEPAGSA